MKVLSDNLKDLQLVWAVAKALNKIDVPIRKGPVEFGSELVYSAADRTFYSIVDLQVFNPVKDGNLVLALIERFGITLNQSHPGKWTASVLGKAEQGGCQEATESLTAVGNKPVVAVLRAAVKVLLGYQVDVPENLPIPEIVVHGQTVTFKRSEINGYIAYDYEIAGKYVISHSPTSWSSLEQALEEATRHARINEIQQTLWKDSITFEDGFVVSMAAIMTSKIESLVMISASRNAEQLNEVISKLNSDFFSPNTANFQRAVTYEIELTEDGYNTNHLIFNFANNEIKKHLSAKVELPEYSELHQCLIAAVFDNIPDDQVIEFEAIPMAKLAF